MKTVRVAFHFLLAEQAIWSPFYNDCGPLPYDTANYYGQGNFTEISDGNGDYSITGYDIAKMIVDSANAEFDHPAVQRRKDSTTTYPDPALPVGIQYVLAGVYFHRDDNAYYNVSSSPARAAIHAAYGVGQGQIINVYFTPNLPHGGVVHMVGTSNKYTFLSLYNIYLKPYCRDWAIQKYAPATLNHEVGHLLNLEHTWNDNDGCLDTPRGFEYDHIHVDAFRKRCPDTLSCCIKNANCWRYDTISPGCPVKPCDEWHKISNNGMDYNQAFPHAYTNCQIERMHANLEGSGNAYVYSCDGCLPAQAFFDIRNPFVCPDGQSVMLDASGSFNATEYRYEICEVNVSTGICTSAVYSSGWMTGTPGQIDLTQVHAFEDDTRYKITLFANNDACSNVHEFSRDIDIPQCLSDPPFVYVSVLSPVTSFIDFEYEVMQTGMLEVVLVNATSGQGTVLKPLQQVTAGTWNESHNISSLGSGTYFLIAIFDGQLVQETVIKI